jgi:hypothetical protein
MAGQRGYSLHRDVRSPLAGETLAGFTAKYK